MKVKDIIRLTDDKTQILIYAEDVCLTCMIEKDWYECGRDTDPYLCDECEHFGNMISARHLYAGTADDVPIKMAELVITEINCREYETYYLGHRKKRNPIRASFLGIRVKED